MGATQIEGLNEKFLYEDALIRNEGVGRIRTIKVKGRLLGLFVGKPLPSSKAWYLDTSKILLRK